MSTHPRLALTAAAILATTVVGLTGCAAQSAESAPASDQAVTGSVTLYTSEPQNKVDEIIAAFAKEQPGITVTPFRAATGDLTARIATEEKSGGVKADLLWAADAGTFDAYAAKGLLSKYTPKGVDEINKNVVDPNGFYVGTRIIPTVIAYNTTAIKTPPTSWAELTDSKYSGKITMPNPDVSGAAAYNAAVWYNDPSLGDAWLTKLAANKPVIAASNGPVSQAVASGTQPIGVVVDYLVRDLKAAGSPIAVSYPSEGVPYVSEPVGIFAASKDKPAAQLFEDFLISNAGQKLAVKQSYLPVRTDVGSPEGAPAIGDIKTLTPSLANTTAVQPKAVARFDELFG